MTASPKAKRAKVLADWILEIAFTDGQIRYFDVKPLLKYPVYEKLKEQKYLEQVFVDSGIVQWPGEEDISPDTLFIDSRVSA